MAAPSNLRTRLNWGLLPLTAALCLAMRAPLLAHDEPRERIAHLSREIEQRPSDAELYLSRGGLHLIEKHWEAALADFDRAAQLDPTNSAIDFYRGRGYLESGSPQAARENLDRFLARHPIHVQALLARARTLRQLGEPRLAADDYTWALAQMRDPVPVLFLERADALAAVGKPDLGAAIDSLDEGIARLGSLVALQSRAIDLEVRARRYHAALGRVDQILLKSPRKERWLARRGEVLEQAGLNDEAHASYSEALAAIKRLPRRLGETPAIQQLAADLINRLKATPTGQ